MATRNHVSSMGHLRGRHDKEESTEDRETDEEKHHMDEEDGDDDDDDLHSNTIAPSPTRLVVTNDGSLDRSLLKRAEGFMYKKGGAVNARGGFRNWKKRWFVLETVDFMGTQGFELQYFDQPNGKLKGKVNLNDLEIHSESRSAHNKKIKYEFQLILQNGGILQLSCDEEVEREEWIETFNTIITFLRKVTTSSTMLLDGYDPMCEDEEESFQIGEEIGQNCQAFGPGLFGSEAGSPTQFVVQVHDLLGQVVNRGGMPITATITDGAVLYYVAMLENDDGLYYGHYTIGRCGKYQLSIKLNDEHHVFGSPFDIEIFPAKTVSKFCIAEGEALERVSAMTPSTFTILAMDGFGNRKTRGGDPFEVGVMGAARLIDLQDNGDGTYSCTVEAIQKPSASTAVNSSLMIMASLYGRPIFGSPFKPVITDFSMAFAGMMAPNNAFQQPNLSRSASQSVHSPAQSIISTPAGSSRQRLTGNGRNTTSGATSNGPPDQVFIPPPPPASVVELATNQTPSKGSALKTSDLQSPLLQPGSGRPKTLIPPELLSETQSNTMSRLERSRQRALIAKSVAEGNKQAMVAHTEPSGFTQHSSQQLVESVPLPREIARPPDATPRQYASHNRFAQSLQNKSNDDVIPHASTPNAGSKDQLSISQGMSTNQRGSKLSQLAQRNAQLLQAKRAGIPIQPEMNLESPTAISRNAYMSELSANIRSGLGKFSATFGMNTTQAEVDAWEQTNRACSSDVVIDRIIGNAEILNQVFNLFADRIDGVSVIKIMTTQGHGGLFRLLELYEIIPHYCTRSEVKTLFTLITNGQRNLRTAASQAGTGAGLDFNFFVKSLIMLSMFSFGRGGFGSTNIPEAKVDAMFSRWGLADSNKLANVRRQLNAR